MTHQQFEELLKSYESGIAKENYQYKKPKVSNESLAVC
jgi:hypothetical protein